MSIWIGGGGGGGRERDGGAREMKSGDVFCVAVGRRGGEKETDICINRERERERERRREGKERVRMYVVLEGERKRHIFF